MNDSSHSVLFSPASPHTGEHSGSYSISFNHVSLSSFLSPPRAFLFTQPYHTTSSPCGSIVSGCAPCVMDDAFCEVMARRGGDVELSSTKRVAVEPVQRDEGDDKAIPQRRSLSPPTCPSSRQEPPNHPTRHLRLRLRLVLRPNINGAFSSSPSFFRRSLSTAGHGVTLHEFRIPNQFWRRTTTRRYNNNSLADRSSSHTCDATLAEALSRPPAVWYGSVFLFSSSVP